jgi:uncharacterized protein YgiB involved in biofilm formation
MNCTEKLGIAALITAIALSLTGCGKSKIDKAEDGFVSGCRAEGGSRSICSCAFENMKDHYGNDKIIAIMENGRQSIPSDFGQVMAQSAMLCRDK